MSNYGSSSASKAVEQPAPSIVAKALLLMIRAYQLVVSPILPPCCRFEPSCSRYAHQALARYGPYRGIRLAVRRILKCHPFHPGGYDPVP